MEEGYVLFEDEIVTLTEFRRRRFREFIPESYEDLGENPDD